MNHSDERYMIVTVWSASAHQFNELQDSPETVVEETWTGTIPEMSLESAFRFFNRVERGDTERLEALGYRLPSLSVGDHVTVNGETYVVDPVGFHHEPNPDETKEVNHMEDFTTDKQTVVTGHLVGALFSMPNRKEVVQTIRATFPELRDRGDVKAVLMDVRNDLDSIVGNAPSDLEVPYTGDLEDAESNLRGVIDTIEDAVASISQLEDEARRYNDAWADAENLVNELNARIAILDQADEKETV